MKDILKSSLKILVASLLIQIAATDCPAKQGLKGTECVPCDDKQCLDCAANYAVCKTCPEGFGIKSNKCSPCSSFCLECQDINKCTKCRAGSVLTGSICEECGSFCTKCFSVNRCSECQNGYFLSNGRCVLTCPEGFAPMGNACARCPLDCVRCSTSTICNSCSVGFFKDFQGNTVLCEKCMLGCAECSSGEYCERCESGYTQSSNGYCDGNNGGNPFWWFWMILGLLLVSLFICYICYLLLRKPELNYQPMVNESMPQYKSLDPPIFESSLAEEYEPRFEPQVMDEPESFQENLRVSNGPLVIKQYEGAPPTRVDIGPPVEVKFTPPRQSIVIPYQSQAQGLQFYDQNGNRSQF